MSLSLDVCVTGPMVLRLVYPASALDGDTGLMPTVASQGK
jgi:hypothetical protein